VIAHKLVPTVGLAMALAVTVGVTPLAQSTDAGTADILRRATSYQFQFRAGKVDIVPEYVAMLWRRPPGQ
jgi:hypothetical protein